MTTAPPGGPFDWRSTESCSQLLALPGDGWAWEFLRCNPRYQATFAAWAGRVSPVPEQVGKIVHLRAADVAEASVWDVLPFRLTRAQRHRWLRLLAAFGLLRRSPPCRRAGRRRLRRRSPRHW